MTQHTVKVHPTFEGYRRAVDMAVQIKCGLSIDDLDDCPIYDWFEDGVAVATAARRAIRNAGGPC